MPTPQIGSVLLVEDEQELRSLFALLLRWKVSRSIRRMMERRVWI
jgi:hypothetical protein